MPEDRFWSEPENNEISPQLQMTLDILAAVQKEFSIDPDRIYLAGQSMGGLGVWGCCKRSPIAGPRRWCSAPTTISRIKKPSRASHCGSFKATRTWLCPWILSVKW